MLVKDIQILITPYPIESVLASMFDSVGFGVVFVLTLKLFL